MKRFIRLLFLKPLSPALAALFAISLYGCSTGRSIIPERSLFDQPALNVLSEAELGETILSKGISYTLEAIVLKNEIVGGDGVIVERTRVAPQTLVATNEDDKWIYFIGKTRYLGVEQPGGIMVSKTDRTKMLVWGGSLNRGSTPSPVPQVEFVRENVAQQPSFRQELIYNGRSGTTVHFLYRELSSSMMRPAFSQEAQYDLTESNVIGFKGARIEIVEATNTRLRYRVLNSFPSNTQN